jgi:hypothetical protein
VSGYPLSAPRSNSRASSHQSFVDQLLVALQDGERIEGELDRDGAHRRQRIAVGEPPFEDHRHDFVAQLAIDRLAVVPVSVHLGSARRCAALL